MQQNSYERNSAIWLKKDEKTLTSGIKENLDIFELGFSLERDPVRILNFIFESDIFPCDSGSDEEQEFLGLAFSGVPISEVVLWCNVDPERSKNLESFMKFGDLRDMVSFAYSHHIGFYNIDSIENMIWVTTQSYELMKRAMRSINYEFDVLTPNTLREHMSRTASSPMSVKDLPFSLLTSSTQKCGSYLTKKKSVTKKYSKRIWAKRKVKTY